MFLCEERIALDRLAEGFRDRSGGKLAAAIQAKKGTPFTRVSGDISPPVGGMEGEAGGFFRGSWLSRDHGIMLHRTRAAANILSRG